MGDTNPPTNVLTPTDDIFNGKIILDAGEDDESYFLVITFKHRNMHYLSDTSLST